MRVFAGQGILLICFDGCLGLDSTLSLVVSAPGADRTLYRIAGSVSFMSNTSRSRSAVYSILDQGNQVMMIDMVQWQIINVE